MVNRGISPRARAFIRTRASGNMTHTCRIERPGALDFNEGSGLIEPGAATTVYTGPCRIWEVTGGSAVPVNEESIVLQATQLSIPWDTGVLPQRNDEVVILTSTSDTFLVGRRFRILDSAKGGDLRATRRFTVQGIQEEEQ